VRGQMEGVHVANVAELFDCGQKQARRLGCDFSRVIQDVRYGCGGDGSSFRNVTNSYAHDGKYGHVGERGIGCGRDWAEYRREENS